MKNLTKNKDYRQAYNNPGQYDFNKMVEKMENNTNEKLTKFYLAVTQGLIDVKKDRENGIFKRIM